MKDLLIVVPYRNREEHLQGFLENSPKYFNRQNLSYDILICELDQQGDWNAGLSCNSLINFISTERQYKYLYIHHVDIWPVEGSWEFPNEKQVFHNLGDYGSCLMKLEDFLSVGGYSNSFWGWGGEDNDLFNKFRYNGFNVVDKNNSTVKYETKHQGHERKFNGANYAGGIKNLCLIPEENKNNINNFGEHGLTESLTQLSDNIFKHTVIPLKLSPAHSKNNDVLVTYLKGHSDPQTLMPYIKSAMMFAAYEYDVVVCIADETPNDWLLNQLESFGIKTYFHRPVLDNLFIDRYHAYKNFLKENSHYKRVLHTDCTDVFFQSNPFEQIENNLVLTSEDILIKDEKWNWTGVNQLFSSEITNNLASQLVVCGGIIGGPCAEFIELCNEVIQEYSLCHSTYYALDQILLLKIIHLNNIAKNIVIKQLNEAWGVNLHCPVHYPALFKDKIQILNNKVLTADHKRFSIVHQYNRHPELYQTIQNHFGSTYYPVF